MLEAHVDNSVRNTYLRCGHMENLPPVEVYSTFELHPLRLTDAHLKGSMWQHSLQIQSEPPGFLWSARLHKHVCPVSWVPGEIQYWYLRPVAVLAYVAPVIPLITELHQSVLAGSNPIRAASFITLPYFLIVPCWKSNPRSTIYAPDLQSSTCHNKTDDLAPPRLRALIPSSFEAGPRRCRSSIFDPVVHTVAGTSLEQH
ncbi:hypothetical protein GGX14DRAFT_397865 [Mycena pura]|uniref:Uncharacterized protein n=1 Tax=Mycena pura TaxID=153505 RepID=A0AAD6V9S3_9AGAR|nr:hypothetical protein GGX14DRAFT_397865 [Mycena pura]